MPWFSDNKMSVITNELTFQIYEIMDYYPEIYIRNFALNTEKTVEIYQKNKSNIAKFTKEYIRKHGKVPMILKFFYDEGNEKINLILSEIIMANNPYEVILKIR